MAKKPVALDGLLNTESRPTDTGIPQRGAGRGASQEKKQAKRQGEKRLTLALDGETYKRLRIHAAKTDQTHQAILEAALAEYLKRANA
ncbi:CopG family transcriptional regulator [Paracoccus aerodenitrificans]|uniref:CopG family transcriptional regulator n=1 Tax=Paracoccus aerodenitrificans TaxID=3017781 RepID=UPI0022F131EA|nr:CopG family transcriptional regulator [Paracoccus aerodenitrificans]WBU62618.1 CopG family transcriptional regulator [Paracoccus aerodenitrificans]